MPYPCHHKCPLTPLRPCYPTYLPCWAPSPHDPSYIRPHHISHWWCIEGPRGGRGTCLPWDCPLLKPLPASVGGCCLLPTPLPPLPPAASAGGPHLPPPTPLLVSAGNPGCYKWYPPIVGRHQLFMIPLYVVSAHILFAASSPSHPSPLTHHHLLHHLFHTPLSPPLTFWAPKTHCSLSCLLHPLPTLPLAPTPIIPHFIPTAWTTPLSPKPNLHFAPPCP